MRLSVVLSVMALVMVVLVAPTSYQPVAALQATELLEDPVLEDRAREVSAQLRCLVCQNQSIDDSNAGLARDLRQLVRERILAGDSNKEVIDFIVARYGDYVLLNPPVKFQTILLWAAPALFLLLGLGLVARLFMRRQSVAVATPAPLSAAEQKALDELIDRKD
jgi:cytochrome c-type biogenesis protein CcmH